MLSTSPTALRKFIKERSRSSSTDSCHVWMGRYHKYGYPVMGVGKQRLSVRRVVWELAHGPIPKRGWIRAQPGCLKGCVRAGHLRCDVVAKRA